MSTTATFSVPFLDIQEQNRRIRPELDEAVDKVVSQGQFILGPAAVLEVKLRYLDEWNRARARHARQYIKLLSGISGLQLPRTGKLEAHAWHLFVVLVDAARRDQLRETLAERGIATGIHYPTPVPLQPAYASLGYQPGDFPVAEDVMNRCLSLPMFPEMTDDQLQYVAEVLRFLTHGTPTRATPTNQST